MFERGAISWRGVYARIGALFCLMAVAGWVGLYFGEHSVVEDEQPDAADANAAADTGDTETSPSPSPCYFLVTIPAGAAESSVMEEIAMAAAAGVHQYVLTVPLPWQGEMDAVLKPIQKLVQRDPDAKLMLHLRLDPPASWLASHPDATVLVDGKPTEYVSLASTAWQQDATTALEALVSAVNAALTPRQLTGYVIACLEEGRWYRTDGYDGSPASIQAFRQWLKARYTNDAAIQASWNDPAVTIDTASVPDRPPVDWTNIFIKLPDMQRHRDFLAFSSETTADAIADIAASLRKAAGKDAKLIATYAFSCGISAGDSGHSALARLLDSDLNGFAGPVSYYDRGLGGAGGVSGPIDSILLHGKEWYLIDDTRTGITRDAVSGEVSRPKNVQPEDIYNVQQRNFATALTSNLGLFWSDIAGDARLHDEGMWRRFARMSTLYQEVTGRSGTDKIDAPILAVVVDELAGLLLNSDKLINELLLEHVRASALRTGIETRYYLLDDLLQGKTPPAQVYLFLNAFQLGDESRDRLHQILQEQKAAAIWMYAPGYWNGKFDVENVSKTVRMKVNKFDGPATAGSTAKLPGRYLEKDAPIGDSIKFDPLFYIEDVQTNEIAQYAESGKTSVAVSFFEEGWASIFCAEPSLTPALLRELLGILEIRLLYKTDEQPSATNFYDAVYVGHNLIAIHARESGERAVDVGLECDIHDLLAPEIGWQRKSLITLPLKTGDTRLLELTPVGQ
jgi:hypothetical protein